MIFLCMWIFLVSINHSEGAECIVEKEENQEGTDINCIRDVVQRNDETDGMTNSLHSNCGYDIVKSEITDKVERVIMKKAENYTSTGGTSTGGSYSSVIITNICDT